MKKKWMCKLYKKFSFSSFRYESVCPTWMDTPQSLQWGRGNCMELRNTSVWHGLWRHSLWNRRSDLPSWSKIPYTAVTWMSRPNSKMLTNCAWETAKPRGDFETSLASGSVKCAVLLLHVPGNPYCHAPNWHCPLTKWIIAHGCD